jgi:transcription elongation GreA/GreB family factor
MIEKKQVIRAFLTHFESELRALTQSAKTAHEAATHEESKAEDRHDTFAIEASYLAAGQSARALDLENTLTEYRGYLEKMNPHQKVDLGAWVELKTGQKISSVFIADRGGGTQIQLEGKTISILTPQSPLGEALVGAVSEDEITVESKNGVRDYLVVSIQ